MRGPGDRLLLLLYSPARMQEAEVHIPREHALPSSQSCVRTAAMCDGSQEEHTWHLPGWGRWSGRGGGREGCYCSTSITCCVCIDYRGSDMEAHRHRAVWCCMGRTLGPLTIMILYGARDRHGVHTGTSPNDQVHGSVSMVRHCHQFCDQTLINLYGQ